MFMPSILGTDIFDDIFGGYGYTPGKKPARMYRMTTSETMKTDIKETDDGFELDIDLPGYKKEDVTAELKDGYMTITATTHSETEEGDKDDTSEAKKKTDKYIYRERFVGSCSRSFFVGDNITEEDVKAKFEDGILKMFVPKKEDKPKVEEKKLISIAG